MAGPLNGNEFSQPEAGQPMHKAFTPLSQTEPTKYDPTGQQKRWSDVPWTDGSRAVSKMRKEAWRGETYIPDQESYGYNRQAMNSTF